MMQRCINVFGLKEREKLLRDELYVMLMLMRSEGNEAVVDCDDSMTVIACTTNTDACPAACRENDGDNTDTVVKAGDLEVTAKAATERSAIKGAASDLDTLTFKTSENVTISKVVLERYGYSSASDIDAVRLENSDGTVIAEEKTVNSKDQVTLSIKKGYRDVDGTENWTIVVRLVENASGSTIGFKVKDVTSTAEDVNLDDYRPFTYDIVTYDAAKITLDDKGSEKDYNYEDGESYEIAKLKIKAGASALEVNGFNLTNVFTGDKLDLEDFVDGVEVVADGKSVKGVNYTIDDDELNVTFDKFEVAAKDNVTFTISMKLKDFDEYGQGVEFVVKSTSDVKIVEKKTGARVEVVLPHSKLTNPADADIAEVWSDAHAFAGSKIRLTSTKLGSVDAAQGAEDIVVLEGEIEIAEAIDKWSFDVTATYSTGENLIDEMTISLAGDDYTASRGNLVKSGDVWNQVFSFSNVEIEKSGKIQVLIDVDDDATQGATISLKPTINKAVLAEKARYSDARSLVKAAEVKGSTSFATKITIQPSKASLENNLSKRVEFTTDGTSKKTVFDGTYTAKKGAVYLNAVTITGNYSNDSDITFYVYIDGEEVATLDPRETDTFSDIKVEAGKSVSVKVEAEVSKDEPSSTVYSYSLELSGDDENGNENSGNASDNLVDIKVVEKGTFNVSDSTSSNTVLLKARNTKVASFVVKPSNSSSESLTLEDLELAITPSSLTKDDIRLKIDGVEYDPEDDLSSDGNIVYEINEEIPAAGYTVEVSLKNEYAGKVEIALKKLNGLTQTKTYSKSYADALVYIDSQKDEGDFTQYILGVDLYDDTYTVKNVRFYTDTAYNKQLTTDGLGTEVSDGDDFTIDNGSSTETIRGIKYDVVVPADEGSCSDETSKDETTCKAAVKTSATCKDGETAKAGWTPTDDAAADKTACEADNQEAVNYVYAAGDDTNPATCKDGETAKAEWTPTGDATADKTACEADNQEAVNYVYTDATYHTWTAAGEGVTTTYSFNNSDLADYFKVNGTAWRVFSNNN